MIFIPSVSQTRRPDLKESSSLYSSGRDSTGAAATFQTERKKRERTTEVTSSHVLCTCTLISFIHTFLCVCVCVCVCVCTDVLSLIKREEHTIARVYFLFRIVSIVFDDVALKRSELDMRYMTGKGVCMCVSLILISIH